METAFSRRRSRHRFIDKAVKLSICNIAIHKGLVVRAQVPRLRRVSMWARWPLPSQRQFPDLSPALRWGRRGPLYPMKNAPTVSTATFPRCGTWVERMPNSVRHGASDAQPGFRGTRWANCSSTAAEQRALGAPIPSVRLAAGSDPGVSHLPDRGVAAREIRLSADDERAARQGVRSYRARFTRCRTM